MRLFIDQQKLLLRQALLTAWCDTLTVLQQDKNRPDTSTRERLQRLLDKEVALMGELTLAKEQSISCTVPGSDTVLPDPGPNTLSPGTWVGWVGWVGGQNLTAGDWLIDWQQHLRQKYPHPAAPPPLLTAGSTPTCVVALQHQVTVWRTSGQPSAKAHCQRQRGTQHWTLPGS